MLFSIVIPCYKSSHTIRDVVELSAAEYCELIHGVTQRVDWKLGLYSIKETVSREV